MFRSPSMLCALAVLFLSVLSCVSAAPVETNADRMARGLPPAKPKGFVVREINGATRTVPDSAKVAPRWPQTSPKPPSGGSSGVVLVKKATGAIEGYLSKNLAANGAYQLTTDKSEAVVVSFSYITGHSPQTSGPFALKPSNNPDVNYPFVGFTPVNGDLSSGSSNYVLLSGVSGQTDPDSHGDFETNVWQESSSNELYPTWINSSGSPANGAAIFYDGHHFGVSFDKTLGTQVKFYYVSN